MLQWFSEIRIGAVNTGIYNRSSLSGDSVCAAYILMIFVFIIYIKNQRDATWQYVY
jgi:hypothetical protein